jgi:histidine triad (HIT) family protein
MHCALCDSLRNERERILYQDAHVFVMVNIEPIKDGHIMILPVRHAEQLGDLTPEESCAFLKAIDLSLRAVTQAYEETPMCFVNGWKHRSQLHIHAHVLPSKKNLRGLYSAAEGLPERVPADKETIHRIMEKLKQFFPQ